MGKRRKRTIEMEFESKLNMQEESLDLEFEPSPAYSPEKRFLASMIIRAVLDMLPTRYELETGHRAPENKHESFANAYRWVMARDSRPPSKCRDKVNFDWCCSEFGVEPPHMRQYILDLLSGKTPITSFVAHFR